MTENLSPGQHGFYGGFFNNEQSGFSGQKNAANATPMSSGATSMFTLQVPSSESSDK